jgi:DNA-binding response OmpR family regulator
MTVDLQAGLTTPRPDCAAQASLVIVADDDPLLRATTGDRLRMRGYRVHEAIDGEHLLKVLIYAALPSTRVLAGIGLVIADMWMPFLSGLDVLERLRRDRRTTPFLLMTSDPNPSLLRRARDLGAGFIPKPFSYDELLAAVQAALGAPRTH